MRSRITPWIAAAVISLSACTTQQQTMVTSPSAQPGRVIVVPAAMRTAGPQILARTVAAGATLRLVFASSVNPDCTSRGLNTVRVTQQPVHGTVRAEEARDFPTFPPNNIRSACNKTKVPGMALLYTPEAGFVGTDYLSLETISIDGGDREFRVALTVK